LIPVVCKRGISGRLSGVSLPLSHYVPPLSMSDEPILFNFPYLLRIHALVSGECIIIDNSRVTTLLDLSKFSDEKEFFSSLRSRSDAIRRKIKTAHLRGYTSSLTDKPRDLSEFSRLQAITRRRQGSPTYPTNFFHLMSEALGDVFRLHVVRKEGQVVAGVAFLYDGERAIYGYGASTNDETILREGVNQLAMWDALRQSFLDGRRLVDFGSSPRTQVTLIAYKEKWGGKTIDCPHSIFRPSGKKWSAHSWGMDRESKSVRAISNVLRFMPLPVFRLVSPLMLRLVS
jgi:hypothetical protein